MPSKKCHLLPTQTTLFIDAINSHPYKREIIGRIFNVDIYRPQNKVDHHAHYLLVTRTLFLINIAKIA